MSIYAIGDVQGCLDSLQRLLDVIQFDPLRDEVWFLGDLINRGPKSLETLRFIKNLPRARTVLGNHDVASIGYLLGAYPHHSERFGLGDLETAEDKTELIAWCTEQPLLTVLEAKEVVLVHAGIYPHWTLQEAQTQARFFESHLKHNFNPEFYNNLMGSSPRYWSTDLPVTDRLRFVYNSLTRMRYCDPQGGLALEHKGYQQDAGNVYPWFNLPLRQIAPYPIFFGHWSALRGETGVENIHALDMGCVWGGFLRAMNVETLEIIQVKSLEF